MGVNMTLNINEAVQKIKQVGGSNARIVPMTGENITGKCQIEIREGNDWHAIVTGLTQRMAEDLVLQATNRVLLG
jgi:hypothetical protein